MFPGFLLRWMKAGLCAALLVELACVPEIKERCRLVTAPSPPPALPYDFAELDALLLSRCADMARASRGLNRSIVIVFRRDFAEVLLPDLCQRLEQARALAVAGRTDEAGRKYQSLLVASQVLAYAVAIQSMAQYADARAMAGGQVSSTQEKFATEATPILAAALGENPRQIERALHDIKSKIEGNPDMEFDLETGEVYDRRSGEPVGNLHDYKGTDGAQRGGQ